MRNASTPSQSFWLGLMHAIRWLAKAVVVALALYIFFPPLWDAIFAGDLETLHKAPYIAADRARYLWRIATEGAS